MLRAGTLQMGEEIRAWDTPDGAWFSYIHEQHGWVKIRKMALWRSSQSSRLWRGCVRGLHDGSGISQRVGGFSYIDKIFSKVYL